MNDAVRGVLFHGWRVEFRHQDQETADQVNHAIAHLYEADGDKGLAAEFLWHRVLEHLEVTTARSAYDELLKQTERDLWEETAKYLPEDVHAAAVQHWEEGDEVFLVTWGAALAQFKGEQ